MNGEQKIDISLVIPLYNEEESLCELMSWIDRVMTDNNFIYESIFIDDGSKDNSWEIIRQLQDKYGENKVKGIRFRRNYGKSPALYVGFDAAKGSVVITMDADLQDSPDEIPELYAMIMNQGYDLVSGWKQRRFDPLNKTLPSKFFNATARLVSGIKLHDFNCGLKAYRNKVVKSIEVYGEMHRYIPILAKRAGYDKIGEKIVVHQARKYGVSKFGWERMIKGYIDLLSVMFISKFGRRPMYIFGTVGTLMFLMGAAISIYLISHKLFLLSQGVVPRGVTEQPLFYIALSCSIVGSQTFLAGFLAEIVNRTAYDRNHYMVDEKL